MKNEIVFRYSKLSDSKKLSILLKQVYIQTYGFEGVSDEFANFITKQFSVERLENLIQENPEIFIVAEYHNNLVGAVEIEFKKTTPVENVVGPELNKLYILEWFCGKGIGEGLLKFAEDTVKRYGAKLFWLWVLDSNERAINFYKKHHFEIIGKAAFQMETNSYMNLVMVKYF